MIQHVEIIPERVQLLYKAKCIVLNDFRSLLEEVLVWKHSGNVSQAEPFCRCQRFQPETFKHMQLLPESIPTYWETFQGERRQGEKS